MSVIQTFLNALNRRVQDVSNQINDIDDQKNDFLELDNLFLKYNIDREQITGEALLNLTTEEFSKLMDILSKDSKEAEVKKFLEAKQVIKLYQKITSEYGDIEEANQYHECLNWINDVAATLHDYLHYYNNEASKTDRISYLKETAEIYKRFGEMFKGDELSTPIFDMNDFNRMLSICGLSLRTKASIKKEIGKANLRLVLNHSQDKSPDQRILEKYRIVLSRKQETYPEEIKFLIDSAVSFTINDIEICIDELIKTHPEKDFVALQNAAVAILLEKELLRLEDTLDYDEEKLAILIAEIAENCEVILDISHKEKPKSNPGLTKDIKEKQDILSLINKAKTIIAAEEEFLHSINQDDYGRYTQLLSVINNKELNLSSAENDKYRLAMIIESLRQELKAFEITIKKYEENPKEVESNYRQQLASIREYLEAYELLKPHTTFNAQSTQEPKTLFYLTDDASKAIIVDNIGALPVSYRKQVKGVINNLTKGIFKGYKKDTNITKHNVFNMERKNVVLSYIDLGTSNILIICAAPKNNEESKTASILDEYDKRIKEIINMINLPGAKELLFDEQANVRDEITNLLEDDKKTKQK